MSALAPDLAAALASAHAAIADEKETHALALDKLRDIVSHAAQRFHTGDVAGAHVSIAHALDLAHEVLGECDAIEPLAALLGYEDPEPESNVTLENRLPCAQCGAADHTVRWHDREALSAPDLVVLETMPEHLRDTHRTARSWGRYPSNGAVREVCGRGVAEEVVAEDADGYASIICDADAEHVERHGYHWSVPTPGGDE